MPRYLLSVHVDPSDRPAEMSDEARREGFNKIASLERDMRADGALVMSVRLDAPEDAVVAHPANGKPVTTDGPYIESKELIGGFYLIDAPDRDAALEWASRTATAIGMPIEVRGIFDSADG
jgi:hypothetical protein